MKKYWISQTKIYLQIFDSVSAGITVNLENSLQLLHHLKKFEIGPTPLHKSRLPLSLYSRLNVLNSISVFVYSYAIEYK